MSAVFEQTSLRDPDVLFRIVNRVAIITLNRPAALNALSHSMIHELLELVERCRVDQDIVALVLRGAGEKSFCAGGDVRALYEMRQRNDNGWQSFFIDEYRLDYTLYHFSKPVVALLDGIVMGGGMGLGQGAWLRVVTERTKMAMPETRIGFVPDVGATHFLGQMPTEMELYVGLTGVTLSGAEALHFGLADLCVPFEWLGSFEERLMRIVTADASAIDLMRALRTVFEPPCNIVPHAGLAVFAPLIKRHFERRSTVECIVASMRPRSRT